MSDRSSDWYAQAERDLERAESSKAEFLHEWACFAAHQAAELAVKALHLVCAQEAWGHAVAQLLQDLPGRAPEELVEQARVLDSFSVPTRYPYGHPAGAPFSHYGPIQSEEAIRYARAILGVVGDETAGRRGG